MKILSRTAQAEIHNFSMDTRKKRFKTPSATLLDRYALKIGNKKNLEFLLCDNNAKKSQVGSSIFSFSYVDH